MRRSVTIFAALVVVVGFAAPAWAHEEINPSSFRIKAPTFFTLSAADEQKVELVNIILTAPKGVPLGTTTKEPTGWTVAQSDTAITWTAGGSALVKPDHFEQWGFETDGADKPGTFTFKVTLGFADRTTTDVDVPVSAVIGDPSPAGGPAPLAAVPIAVTASQSRANAGISVGILALLLSIVALTILASRRRNSPDGTAKPAQDW